MCITLISNRGRKSSLTINNNVITHTLPNRCYVPMRKNKNNDKNNNNNGNNNNNNINDNHNNNNMYENDETKNEVEVLSVMSTGENGMKKNMEKNNINLINNKYKSDQFVLSAHSVFNEEEEEEEFNFTHGWVLYN